MAAGDLTASTPTLCATPAAVKVHIDTLNLAAVTDFLFVVPCNLGGWLVFKVLRAAA